ncbi:hypothetical protein DXB18_00770 [Clostridium sp. OM02-18AC]|uniref:stage III sporulation protein AF n=1 Tax=Clostridium sp. OM02-18AC TaxID=2292311 RepID=UPI000EDC7C96|nr:stage III sporulation protein AF [Clostridium sp. OM02-18AC]RHV69744.1 hypothetical protein DXB18_00770 [Clostridium sp. OM02-18AC]
MSAVYEWIRNLTALFLFFSVVENLLPGKKYGKYIRLFAGMVLILLVVEPLTNHLDLEEVLARSYESLLIREEAGGLEANFNEIEKERVTQILKRYEETVCQDIRKLADACGMKPVDCNVSIDGEENSAKFGAVKSISIVLQEESDAESTKKLLKKIQEYYGLEENYVEIQIAGGKRSVDLSADHRRDSLYSGVSGGE